MFTSEEDYVIMSKDKTIAARGDDMIKQEMIAMLLAGGRGSRLEFAL